MITQNRWDEMTARFQQTVDALGKGIDQGILETVIALNILGVETSASCEGHLDHGIAAPWIDIQVQSAQGETQHIARMFTQARGEQQRQTLPQTAIDALFAQAHERQEQVRQLHLAQHHLLLDLLAQFYAQRLVPYDVRLILYPRDTLGRARFTAQGGEYQMMHSLDRRAQKLLEYQEEMRAFTAFLKAKMFTQEGNAEPCQ